MSDDKLARLLWLFIKINETVCLCEKFGSLQVLLLKAGLKSIAWRRCSTSGKILNVWNTTDMIIELSKEAVKSVRHSKTNDIPKELLCACICHTVTRLPRLLITNHLHSWSILHFIYCACGKFNHDVQFTQLIQKRLTCENLKLPLLRHEFR